MVSAGGYLACFGEWFVEDYFWFGEFEGLAGAVVEEERDVVEVELRMDGQVGALGQVLAQEAVGVLVAAALPGAVGVAEEHRDAGGHAEPGVAGHLGALVPGQRPVAAGPAVGPWPGPGGPVGAVWS